MPASETLVQRRTIVATQDCATGTSERIATKKIGMVRLAKVDAYGGV
jgi:hypothetical protein